MAHYSLFWFGGKKEVLPGDDIMDAIHNAGHFEATDDLEFWERGDSIDQYVWSPEENDWIETQ